MYASLIAGTEKGVTLHDNIQAFDEIGLIPRIAADLPPKREMSTTVLGQDIDFPVIRRSSGRGSSTPAGRWPWRRRRRRWAPPSG